MTAFTAHTRKFLAADKLIWHGDARDTDLPSVVETDAGPIVQIPGSDFTDNRTLRSSPQDLWDVYKETFDYLREKRAAGASSRMSMHCHFGGRPLITAVFEKILGYMRQHDDVWFASFGEIARWVMDTQRDADTHARRLIKNKRQIDAVRIHAGTARRGARRLPRAHASSGSSKASAMSARASAADRILITPRRALGLVTEAELVELDLDGQQVAGEGGPPLEVADASCGLPPPRRRDGDRARPSAPCRGLCLRRRAAEGGARLRRQSRRRGAGVPRAVSDHRRRDGATASRTRSAGGRR